MSTSDRAREAATSIAGITSFPDDSWGEFPEGVPYEHAVEIADAASDVWRSDMKDLLEHFDLACRWAKVPKGWAGDTIIENLEAARKRAVEAIG